jgi:hypothetical protein
VELNFPIAIIRSRDCHLASMPLLFYHLTKYCRSSAQDILALSPANFACDRSQTPCYSNQSVSATLSETPYRCGTFRPSGRHLSRGGPEFAPQYSSTGFYAVSNPSKMSVGARSIRNGVTFLRFISWVHICRAHLGMVPALALNVFQGNADPGVVTSALA